MHILKKANQGCALDSQDRAAFEDIEFLTVYAFGELLQKCWLPLTAGVRVP
jgi:hypothetical protein